MECPQEANISVSAQRFARVAGIGRRSGLKIRRRESCGFESHLGHLSWGCGEMADTHVSGACGRCPWGFESPHPHHHWELAEWMNAHEWRSCRRLRRLQGSNPWLPARIFRDAMYLRRSRNLGSWQSGRLQSPRKRPNVRAFPGFESQTSRLSYITRSSAAKVR